MLFSTPTQYIVLALALVAGWLLGLASHPGGRRWKERYATERDAHAVTRQDAEVKLGEANRLTDEARRGADDRLIQANARIADLEAENARLAKATPAPVPAPAPVAVPTAPAPTPMPANAAAVVPGDAPVYAPVATRPAYSSADAKQRGWFDWV